MAIIAYCGIVLLLGYYCWECVIVRLSLAKVTMATITYCMGKRLKALLPLGTEDL
jgi:hypothetical protein